MHALAAGTDRHARDVVATRLRGLTDDAGTILGAIAVVGRPIGALDLADLLGWPAERAADAASGLAARGLVVERDAGLQVVHDLLREAAVGRLRLEARRELHRALSERLERTAGYDVAQLREALDHRRLGGLAARDLAERLLRSSRRRWLGRDGLRGLAKIVDDDEVGTPAWAELAVDVASLAVELNDHAFALERSGDLADRSVAASMEATASLGAAKAAFELERGAVARAWIERARERSGRAATPAQEAALDAVDALVLIWLEHRLAEGEIVADRAVRAVRELIHDAGGAQHLPPEAWRATLDALRARWDASVQRDDRVPASLTQELLAVTAHDASAHLSAIVLAGHAAAADTHLDIAEERFRLAWTRPVGSSSRRRRWRRDLARCDPVRHWSSDEAEAVVSEVQALVARAGSGGRSGPLADLPDELRLCVATRDAAASLLRRRKQRQDAHRQIPFPRCWRAGSGFGRPNAQRGTSRPGWRRQAGGCPRCAAEFISAAQAAAQVGDPGLGRRLLAVWTAERGSPDPLVDHSASLDRIANGGPRGSPHRFWSRPPLTELAAQADRLRLHVETTVVRLEQRPKHRHGLEPPGACRRGLPVRSLDSRRHRALSSSSSSLGPRAAWSRCTDVAARRGSSARSERARRPGARGRTSWWLVETRNPRDRRETAS